MKIFTLVLLIQSLFYYSFSWQTLSYLNITNVIANQIDFIGWSQSQGIYYISVLNNTFRTVYKYQKVPNSPDILLASFNAFNQTLIMNRVFEVNKGINQYVLISSDQNATVYIFNGTSGTYLTQFVNLQPTNTFLYSETRDILISLSTLGNVIFGFFDQLLINNISTLSLIDTLAQYLQGQLSPNQQYLAIASALTGQFKIYDLVNSGIAFYDDYTYADATIFSWDDTSTICYFYDPDFGLVKSVNMLNVSVITSALIFTNPFSMYIYQFVYVSTTQQILIFVQDFNASGHFFIMKFDTLVQNVTQVDNHVYSYNISQVVVSPVSTSGMMSFHIWSMANVLYEYGEVIFVPVVQTIAGGNNDIYTIQYIKSLPIVKSYSEMMDNTLNSTVVTTVNKLPGSRKFFKLLLTFFSNFDDIWLYYYHQRNYDYVLAQTFDTVKSLQNQKWQLLQLNTLQNSLGFSVQSLTGQLTTVKLPFTSSKFLQIQGQSNGYILQTLNFYTTNFIILFFMYIGGKLVYKFLNSQKITLKQFFSQYDYWMYLPIICVEGNIQYLSYTFQFQMESLVKSCFFVNFLNSFVIGLNFVFFLLIVSTFYIIRYIYLNHAQNLFENCHHTKHGMLYLTFQFGIRNILLGMVHGFNQISYINKISLLIFIETTFLVFSLIYVRFSSETCFIKKSKQWINIWTALIRIALVSTFLIQQNVKNFDQQKFGYSIFSELYAVSLSFYMYIWFISFVIEMTIIFFQLKHIFTTSRNKISISNKISLKNGFNNDENLQVKIKKRYSQIISTKNVFDRSGNINQSEKSQIEQIYLKGENLQNGLVKTIPSIQGMINQYRSSSISSKQVKFQIKNNLFINQQNKLNKGQTKIKGKVKVKGKQLKIKLKRQNKNQVIEIFD